MTEDTDFIYDSEAEPNMRTTIPSSPVSELVEALRECAGMVREGKCEKLSEFWHDEAAKLTAEACAEAADRLTALEAENARLRNAGWMSRCRMLIDLIEYMNSNEESADGEDLDMVMAFKADLPSPYRREATIANEALKPCPFCGGEPKAHLWENNCGDGYSGVQCTACSAEVAIPLSVDDDGKIDLQNAIEAWNGRVALSSDAVAGGDPVAWRHRWKNNDGSWCGWLYEEDEHFARELASIDGECEPVYTAPPELDQLRERVKELEADRDNIETLLLAAEHGRSADEVIANYRLIRRAVQNAHAARRVREGGKV